LNSNVRAGSSPASGTNFLLMDIKKYFQFTGTISGLNYFLRNFISYIAAFMGGYMLGYGVGINQIGLITLGLLFVTPAILFSLTSIYKRLNALYSDSATTYLIGIILIQVLSQFLEEGGFKSLISLAMVIVNLVLIFSNSKIENHEG
jgi:uncharacterized membrane protein YhaH (DUF805 family)